MLYCGVCVHVTMKLHANRLLCIILSETSSRLSPLDILIIWTGASSVPPCGFTDIYVYSSTTILPMKLADCQLPALVA